MQTMTSPQPSDSRPDVQPSFAPVNELNVLASAAIRDYRRRYRGTDPVYLLERERSPLSDVEFSSPALGLSPVASPPTATFSSVDATPTPSRPSSPPSSSGSSEISDEDFGPLDIPIRPLFVDHDYQAVFLCTILTSFQPLAALIGWNTLVYLLGDVIGEQEVENVPYIDSTVNIVILRDRVRRTLPMECTVSFEQASALFTIMSNHVTASMIASTYYRRRETNPQDPEYDLVMKQLVRMIQTTKTRIWDLPGREVFLFQMMISGFRAAIDDSMRRAAVILNVFRRNVDDPGEQLNIAYSLAKINWCRRQKHFISLRGMREGHAQPVPEFQFRADPSYQVQSGDDEDLLLSTPEGIKASFDSIVEGKYVEQGWLEDVLGKYMAEPAGNLVAKAGQHAVNGIVADAKQAIENSVPFKIGSTVVDAGVTIAKGLYAVFFRLVELFPVIMPLFAVFSCYMFRETGEVKWAVIVVCVAMAGGFQAAKWFHSTLLPRLRQAWSIIARGGSDPPEMVDAGVVTDLNLTNLMLDDDVEAPINTANFISSAASFFSSMFQGGSPPPKNSESVGTDSTFAPSETEESPMTEQSGVGDLLSNDVLAGVASTALLTSGLFLKEPASLVTAFSRFNAVSIGLTGLFTVIVKIGVFVMENVGYDYPYSRIPGLNGRDMQVSAILDKIVMIIDKSNKGTIPKTTHSLIEVECLIKDGRAVLSSSHGSALSGTLFRRLEDLEKIRAALAMKVGNSALVRAQPTVIMLVGPPGNGKSSTAMTLAHCLASKTLEYDKERLETFRSDAGSAIFCAPAGEFYDGIDENCIVFIDDDFLQEVPGNGKVSPGASFVKRENPVRWNAPMAALEKKNAIFINHRFTILSTNIKTIKDKTMEDPRAMGRRIDFILEPVMPENSKEWREFGALDMKYQARKMDPQSRKIIPAPIEVTFTEFFHLALAHQEKNQDFFRRTKNAEESVYKSVVGTECKNKEELLKEFADLKWDFRRDDVPDNDPLPQPRRLYRAPRSDNLRENVLSGAFVQEMGDREEVVWHEAVGSPYQNIIEPASARTYREKRRALATQIVLNEAITYEEAQACIDRFERVRPSWHDLPRRDLLLLTFNDDWRSAFLPTLDPMAIEPVGREEGNFWYSSLRTSLGSIVEKTKEFFSSCSMSFDSPYLIALLSGVSAAIGLKSFYDTYMSGGEQYQRTPNRQERRKASSREIARRLARAKKVSARTFEEQASFKASDAMIEFVQDKMIQVGILRNYGHKITYTKSGTCLPISANLIVMPRHFITRLGHAELDDGVIKAGFKFETKDWSMEITMDDIEMLSDPEDTSVDRCLIRILAKQWPARPNIIEHFAGEDSIKTVCFSAGYTPQAVLVWKTKAVALKLFHTPFFKIDLDYDDPDDDRVRKDSIGYSWTTMSGDCGSILVGMEGRGVSAKIFGMHYAGNGVKGQSAPISKEWIVGCIRGTSAEPQLEGVTVPVLPKHKLDFTPNSGVDVVTRHCELPSRVFVKNDIVQFAPNGVETLPKTPLTGPSNTDPRLFTKNRASFTVPVLDCPEFTPERVSAIVDDIVQMIEVADTSEMECRVLSFADVMNGNDMFEIDALDCNTSPGYPCTSYDLTRKDFFVSSSDGRRVPREHFQDLMENIAHMESLALAGYPLPVIWQIFHKGERLKIQKIADGKVRDVNAAPLDFLVLSSMYLGAAVGKIKRGAPFNGCFITSSPQCAEEWHAFTMSLKAFDDARNCGSGDFVNFDHSHSRAVLEIPAEVFRRLYPGATESERRARDSIMGEIMHPKLIFGSVVEQRDGCLPSGALTTTPWNCIIVHFLMRWTWLRLHGWDLTCIPDFKRHIKPYACGDDSIYATSKAYAGMFTEAEMARAVRMLGYNLTSGDKTPPKEYNTPLENHTFVKRGFRFEPYIGKFVGPMVLDAALEICMWSRSGQNFNLVGASNCEDTMRELSLHGKEVYGQWISKIKAHGKGVWSPETTEWSVVFLRFAKENTEVDVTPSEDEKLRGRVNPRGDPVSTYKIQSSNKQIIIMTTAQTEPIKHLVDSGANQNTYFSDDAAGKKESPATFDSSSLTSLLHVEGTQDITAYLSRPYIAASGVFSTSDTGAIAGFSPYLVVGAAWSTKINNVQLIRADVEVTIKLNAQRFDTGRYILYYVPQFGSKMPAAGPQELLWNSNLTQYTQMLGVEVDLATTTSASFTIPWMSMTPYWPDQSTATDQWDGGRIYLRPYAALQQVNSNGSPGYSIYVRFLNIKLGGPTITQAGTREEQVAAGIGPVSGFASKVSKSATILGEIPFMGPYMNVVSWVSDILGQTAKVWGWSKPPVLNAPSLVQQRPTAYVENVDGCSTARVLAGFSTNQVEPVPDGVGPSEDQMALMFFVKKYAYVTSFSWTTSNPAGTSLGYLAAKAWWTNSAGLAFTVPPVSYPLTMFSKWRGGLKFRVKLVKNEFYSGRIGIAFAPIEPGGTYAIGLTDYAVQYNRAIIDIRGRTEFEFMVPYSSVRNYLTQSLQFGTVNVFVVDPLVAPDSCPNNITLLVEVAGADDMEYFDPVTPSYTPCLPYSIQSGNEEVLVECFCLGKDGSPSLAVDKAAIGERFDSLRQLVKKLCFKTGMFVSAGAGTGVRFMPFWISVAKQLTSLATTPTTPNYPVDFVSLIAACYGITTGSMRVQLTPSASGTRLVMFGCSSNNAGSTTMTVDGNAPDVRTIFSVDKEGVADFQVPGYNQYLGRPTAANLSCTAATLVPGTYPGTNIRSVALVCVTSDALGTVTVTRQAADDFNCLWFVATPCLY